MLLRFPFRGGLVAFALLWLLLPSTAAAAPVSIAGLSEPVAVDVLPSGRVFIAEKPGRIKTAPSLDAGSATTALDISSTVGSNNDHGLTSIAFDDGWLYGLYTVDQGYEDECHDFENGCPMPGRISRWPVQGDGGLGPEDIVLDGAIGPGELCVQATTHGMDNVEIAPDGKLLVSTGDGANFVDADIGQHGGDPCGDSGALRSQTDSSPMGKLLEVDPESGAWTALAKGLRNPFRTTLLDGDIYATDTGWYKFEEINRIALGGENFGWPCFEGPTRQEAYESHDLAECEQLYADGSATNPFYSYPHPANPDETGNYASVSALAGHQGRIWFGDYTQNLIAKLSPDGSTRTVVMQGDIFPVDLLSLPDGRLLYVDIGLGQVREVSGGDGGGGDPPPVDPSVEIDVGGAQPWSDGDQLSFSADSNLDDARQPAAFDWQVTLVSECDSAGRMCQRRPVPFALSDRRTGTVTTPQTTGPAFLRFDVRVTNASGTATVADDAVVANAAGAGGPAPVSYGVAGQIDDVNFIRDSFEVQGVSYGFDQGDFFKLSGAGVPYAEWKAALSPGDEVFGEVRVDPAGASELDLIDGEGDLNGVIDGYVIRFDTAANELVLQGGQTVRYDPDDFFKVMGAGQSLPKWERELSVCDRVRGRYRPGGSSELDIRSSGIDSTAPVSIDGLIETIDTDRRRLTIDGEDLLYDTNDYLKVGDRGEFIVNWERQLELGDNIRGCHFTNPGGVSELSATGLTGPPSTVTAIDGPIDYFDPAHRLLVIGETRFIYDDDDLYSVDGSGDSLENWELELLEGRRVTGTFRPGGASDFDIERPAGGEPLAFSASRNAVLGGGKPALKLRLSAPEEPLTVRLRGRFKHRKAKWRLGGKKVVLEAGQRKVVKLKPKKRRQAKAARRTLRRGGRLGTVVRAGFVDIDGQRGKQRLRLKLRRP